MRRSVFLIGLVTLAGCTSPPHLADTQSGVGFRDYGRYQAAREAQIQRQMRQEREDELRTQQTVQPPDVEQPVPGQDQDDLAADALRALDEAEASSEEVATQEVPAEEVTPTTDNPGISDEQDFQAVAERESIQSDAERIAANREQYQVIQPIDLPNRPGSLGPSVVDYALATNNPVGTQLYRRSGSGSQSRFDRNCARYASSDLAQQDFLEKGGPENDRMGLDPDGDGFACYWDPTPFRAARGN